MKVLYITHTSHAGGSSTALKNIWSQIDNIIDICVLFPDKGVLSEFAEKRKYKCFYLNYGLDIWPKNKTLRNVITFIPRILIQKYKQYIAYKKLCMIIQKIKPDIIHSNVGPIQFAAEAAKKCNVPHIWHLREYQDKDFKMYSFPSMRIFKSKLKTSFIIAITRDIANYFELNTNFKVIYDGVISKKDKQPNISLEDSDYLLFVGRLEDAKGWKDALQVFLKIANDYPRIKLFFAGTFNEKELEIVKKRYIPLNLLKRISFLGFRTDCKELMSKARALLVPSFSEGFGYITVEAMYNGCIVIGRNTSGTKEQFDNGMRKFGSEIGLRFNTQDEFETQLKLVLSNSKQHFKEMFLNAQKTVIELYSVESNAEKVLNIYNKTVTE